MSTQPGIEERLRAALSARADLVQPEDLSHHAVVVQLRPRWQSPWVLLATAAAVLLILGVVFRGLDSSPRSDDLAPKPDAPQLELPADVGRAWKADDLSTPARLDLDGDGVKEKVVFLGEPTEDFDGRIRLQTTLSSTGAEAYGIAELGSTIGTNALDPIDADGDGDQELVLYYEDPDAVGGGGYPLVFDLREGLLVQAVAEQPELLVRAQVPVPGSRTEFYELVRVHDYWFEDGRLFSSRSRSSFASGNMSLVRTETILVDAWEWRLDGDGVLRAASIGCLRAGPEALTPCEEGAEEELPYVTPVSTETFGIGEGADFREGYRYSARLEAFADPSLVVTGDDGRTVNYGLEVAAPRVNVQQPSVFLDGASLFVTSASDPSYVEILAQVGDQLRPLKTVGEIELLNEGGVRTWLTENGGVFTVVEGEDDTWQAWVWTLVSRTQMTAMPSGTVCFDDVDDPSSVRSC